MTDDRRPNESFRAYLLRKEPNLPVIEKSIEEFKAGKPVTQRSVDTGEPLVVEESKRLGFLLVRAGQRVLYRAKLAKAKDAVSSLSERSETRSEQTSDTANDEPAVSR